MRWRAAKQCGDDKYAMEDSQPMRGRHVCNQTMRALTRVALPSAYVVTPDLRAFAAAMAGVIGSISYATVIAEAGHGDRENKHAKHN